MKRRKINAATIWKSAQLYIGFHVDQAGHKRDAAKVWPPKDARATLTHDPERQEAFIVMQSADPARDRDLQIKLRQDKVILRRDEGAGWSGVVIENDRISVQVAGTWVQIDALGCVSQEVDGDMTYLEPNGAVLKKTEFVEAAMSSNGIHLSRRTPDNIASISEDGVLSKAR